MNTFNVLMGMIATDLMVIAFTLVYIAGVVSDLRDALKRKDR